MVANSQAIQKIELIIYYVLTRCVAVSERSFVIMYTFKLFPIYLVPILVDPLGCSYLLQVRESGSVGSCVRDITFKFERLGIDFTV